MVIGCPGSGKSYFSKKLAELTGLPLFHLDMIWHKPDRTTYTREEFDDSLEKIVANKKWIIDGNYSRTLETRMKKCDSVFFLDLPVEDCLNSVNKRIGQSRSDMPWIEDKFDDEFKDWIINFDRDQKPTIEKLLEKYSKKSSIEVIRFNSREEVNEYLNSFVRRCYWAINGSDLDKEYHDNEWGKVSYDDRYLYEMLLLESFQAGLSWSIILKKREDYRVAYDGFDVDKVSNYDEKKIEELINNPKLVRNKLKAKASVSNSIIFKQIQNEFGSFSNYIWQFTDNKIVYEDYRIQTTSKLSDTISKDLTSRGMKFVGSTIIYSYLQAIGVINGHGKECQFFSNESEIQ